MMHLKVLTLVVKVRKDWYRYKVRVFPQAVVLLWLLVRLIDLLPYGSIRLHARHIIVYVTRLESPF